MSSKILFYQSIDGHQATTHPAPGVEDQLRSEGYHRISFLRWSYAELRPLLLRLASRLPALFLFLGTLWRTAGISASAIWYDESVTLYRAGIPFFRIMAEHTDASGDLLLELLERPLMAMSHNLILLRLPSLLAGIISLWLIWLIIQRLNFSLTQRILTVAAAAFLPGLIWISQDARSYALIGVLYLAGLYFSLEAGWLGLLACLGLLGYSHSTGPIFAASLLLISYYLRPYAIKRLSLITVAAGLSWLPSAVWILIRRSGISPQPWEPILTGEWFIKSILQALSTRMDYIGLAGSVLLALSSAAWLFSRVRSRGRVVSWLLFVIPPALMVVISLLWQNVFVYRTLTPALYGLALLIGYEGGRRLSWSWSAALPACWILFLAGGLIFWSPAHRGAYLDRAASAIRSQWRTGDLLVYTTDTVALPFDYYLSDLPHYQWSGISHPYMVNPDMARVTNTELQSAGRIWLITPEDGLISEAEHDQLWEIFHPGEPWREVIYMQAAPIQIYLIGLCSP